MKIQERFHIFFILFLGIVILSLPANAQQATSSKAAADTTVRYPVTKTIPENYEDIGNEGAVDLRTPSNIKSEIEYALGNSVKNEVNKELENIITEITNAYSLAISNAKNEIWMDIKSPASRNLHTGNALLRPAKSKQPF